MPGHLRSVGYLDNHDRVMENQRHSKVERCLKEDGGPADGVAGAAAIDVGDIYNLVWKKLAGDREEFLAAAYTQAVDRIKKKMSRPDTELKELIKS